MTPSPVEALALAYVEHVPEVAALMRDQHAKGRAHYNHPIDEWPALEPEQAEETIRELVDLITYLTKLDRYAFQLDCHRLAYISIRLIRYRDRVTGDPMRSVRPGSILIDPVRQEPNLKAIREAARDAAEHGAREQEKEAGALGVTRSELIQRRIKENA